MLISLYYFRYLPHICDYLILILTPLLPPVVCQSVLVLENVSVLETLYLSKRPPGY